MMEEDRSDLWSVEDISAGDDDDLHLSMDIESLWEILGESPDPGLLQGSIGDLSGGKVQQGESPSDVSNSDHSMHGLDKGLLEVEMTSSFRAGLPVSLTCSTSHSDSRAGAFDNSFDCAGNSVTFDHGSKKLLAQTGSPAGCSGTLADWMLPASCRGSAIAGCNGVIQNFLYYGRDNLEETQNAMPNCRATFSFATGVAIDTSDFREVLDSNQVKTEFDIGPLEGVTYSQHGSLNAFAGKPEPLKTPMAGIDRLLSSDLHDGFNFQYMPRNYEMASHIKDEVEELPNQTSSAHRATVSKSEVGKVVGAGFAEMMTEKADVSRLNVKRESYSLLSPTREDSFTKTDGITIADKSFLHTFPPALPNKSSINPILCAKDERNAEPVFSLGREYDVKLSPHIPPFNSSKKLLVHEKDEKEDLFGASRRVYRLDYNDESAAHRKLNLFSDDHCLDAKDLEKSHVQPSTSTMMGYDEIEYNKLIQPKSRNTHISKVSCQTNLSKAKCSDYHVDDDEDICVIEDISAPSRSNLWPTNRKALVTTQHSTFSDPLNNMGMGGVRHKVNEERLVVQVVLQDFSQPKTEASPPDGVLAVPLLRHQRIALSWMVQKETASLHCSGGILADDQGLGKTISTIALILKERAPSSRACPDNDLETLNLDEDDECVSELDGPKRVHGKSSDVLVNGLSKKNGDTFVQAKGRPAAGTLVVCPTSVLRQWAEELVNKVTSKAKLSVLVYHGGSRTKDPCELAKYDVVLTTYSIVSMEVQKQPLVDKDDDEIGRQEADLLSSSRKRKLPPISGKRSTKDKEGMHNGMIESSARPLARVSWFRVVLDEAQSIKNHRTQVARACWGLRAKRRWCLSGTPIQNAVDDLYSYFRFLKYDPYGVYKSFCSMIKVPINRNPTNGYKKLQAVLKTIMLRRTKGTLLDGEPIINLPPKSIELKKVDFTDGERDFYCRLEADSRAQFAEYAAAGTVKQNYVNILLMLLRLRQACDHPFLIREYNSSSSWRSTVEKAKKLPREKQACLLNCLEASLAICGICDDPPEDAVVTSCGHVFCNQCISEHLTGDDNQCPAAKCKAQLSISSLFSRETLKCSLSEQPAEYHMPDSSGSDVSDKLDPSSCRNSFNSSKIKAALEVLQSLSKPSNCALQNQAIKSFVNGSDFVKGASDSINVAGEKAIVFSQWTRMLDFLETGLVKSSINYRRLDGTMSVTARDKAVKDFNTLPEVRVMIMSLKAASLGLNMVSACHVVLLDLWWNPTTEDQAIDRAHRIGQVRPVTVLRLTVKDTVEDRILALQQKKREMVASAFGEDESGSRQTRLTEEDLNYLFMS